MMETVLTSSVLILLLALLRRSMRGKISPCVQYALWLLAAARLLIPGTLFDVPVSMVGAAAGLQTSLHETFPDPLAVPDSPPEAPSSNAAAPAQPPDVALVPHEIHLPETVAPAWKLIDWPDIIWKTGMAVTGGAMVISNLVFYLRLRRNRKRMALPAAPWSGKLPVYEADGLSSPCLFGLFRPGIYLNEAAMDAEHPEHILAHEYAHYRHGDNVWSVLRCVCLAVHWYNPLVWWAAALSRRDCELACDASALKRLGNGEQIDYGQTLLGMVSRSRHPAALLHTATTMTAGKRAMKERIALIVKRPQMRKATLAIVTALACLLGACAFGGKAAGEPDGTPPVEAGSAALLEFPGLHWNDSMETVIETLGITEEQILMDEEDSADPSYCRTRHLVVRDLPLFGETPQYAYFYFVQYVEAQDDLGLSAVRLDYPDGVDFASVREKLVRQYGEGSEASPDMYSFSNGGALQPSSSINTLRSSEDIIRQIYDEELLARRAAVLEQPGPHRWFWTSDNGALSEDFVHQAAFFVETRTRISALLPSTPPTQEAAEEYVRLQPMVYLWWTDAAPIGGLNITTTVNQVQWNAGEYVLLLQNAGGSGEHLPVSVTISQAASSQSTDTSYITDSEEVKRLWKLYQGFEYEGAYDPTGMGGWPITVSFRFGDETEGSTDVFFILSGHGVRTQDGEDLLLKNVDEIYAEFLRLSADTSYPSFAPDPGAAAEPELDPGREPMMENARSIVEQVQNGADVGEWLPLMSYMDWGVLAQAAVEAGMDEGDGSMAAVNIIGTITQYAEEYGTSIPAAEYMYILSASSGLDGAPAEGYGYMIYRMYELNPSQFSYVVLEMLPESQRNEVLDLFRGEWYFHRVSDSPDAPSREEAIAQLEADLAAGIFASPAEMTLRSAGSTFQFKLSNASGIYALTYASSDPNVAAVDESGVVTAVGPGEAVVSMHYEGTGGPMDFECHIRCEFGSGDDHAGPLSGQAAKTLRTSGPNEADTLSAEVFSPQAEEYYKAGSLPLFQIAFSKLEQGEQLAWLEKIYADEDFAFFSAAVNAMDKNDTTLAGFAEKAYGDNEIAFFSTLADRMDKAELEDWLERALEDEKWNFQSMLFDRLDMDDKKDAQEEKWAQQQMAEYQAVGVTKSGKNYYYQGQLVNIFLDMRYDQSMYTLDLNPAGTVNIKILRDADNNITGAAYMSEAEVEELLEDMQG